MDRLWAPWRMQYVTGLIAEISRPDGYNIGMNAGGTGGRESRPICICMSCRAGMACPLLPQPKVMPQTLPQVWERLQNACRANQE